MKSTLLTIIALITMVGVVSAGSCGSHSKSSESTVKAEKAVHSELDIVETASAAESFTTLLAAVKAAGLVEALKGDGPFTVFAPTDEAFANLPEGTIEALLADTDKLAAVLTYHVVQGRVSAEKAATLNAASTLNGNDIAIAAKDGRVMINDAEVITADIECSNGVIHVIDKVILPMAEAR